MKKYVYPWSAVIVGVFMAIINGANQPIVGIVFSKFMTYLGVPFEYMYVFNEETVFPN